MGFNIGDILELTQDVLFCDKGLICQVVELEEGGYGWVKILEPHKCKDFTSERKHANLMLFKLVRRGGLHV